MTISYISAIFTASQLIQALVEYSSTITVGSAGPVQGKKKSKYEELTRRVNIIHI